MNSKTILTDHTLIINKLEKILKVYDWESISEFLPEGSYLVGGCIRDIVLGRNISNIDFDIVVPSNAIDIGERISDTFKKKLIILDQEREVVRIIFSHISIDIANQTSPIIEEDLESRDCSINAIAFSFDKRCLIDPCNGIKDIGLHLIRTFSERNLINDPLRILRYFRFVSELNFKIDGELITYIEKYKGNLEFVAEERINYEIQRIVRGRNAVSCIKLLKNINIFGLESFYQDFFFIDIENINYEELSKNEKEKFLPIFFMVQILDWSFLEKFKFSKAEILRMKLLQKWLYTLKNKNILQLNESERFNLHKELEDILPSFILCLPHNLQANWLKRWRDKDDKLFHPTNLVNGDVIKNYFNRVDGPLLGNLLNYLSKELAYNRLDNFDEAIYKANQWIKQNAPKCD